MTPQEPRESWHSVEQDVLEGKWPEQWHLVGLSWSHRTCFRPSSRDGMTEARPQVCLALDTLGYLGYTVACPSTS